MSGMKVVVVNCDDNGNIDLEFKNKSKKYSKDLANLMVTYPQLMEYSKKNNWNLWNHTL